MELREETAGREPSKSQTCPECGTLMLVETGYRAWCDACEWNLEPKQQFPSARREQRAQRRAERRGQRLYDEMAKAAAAQDRRHEAARLASYGMAVLVHLIAPALIGFTAWLWVSYGLHAWTVIVTLALVGLAWMSRPRFGRTPDGVVVLERTAAPALFSVVDDISSRLGTRQVSLIGVDARLNAATTSVGVRQRRLIVIGLPLWDVLSAEERVGLLSHEVAHDRGGDLLHHTLVQSSLRTLSSWYGLLRPPRATPRPQSGAGIAGLTDVSEALARRLLSLLAYLVLVVLRLQAKLARRAGPRAEYHADEAAARMASSGAVVTMLDKLFLADRCRAFVRTAVMDRDLEMWSTVRCKLNAVPARERERLRRVARRNHHTVDARHPPTIRRIELLSTRPVPRPQVRMSLAVESAIEEELAQVRHQLAQFLMKR
jgi:Zn-dependent protease with chaperone function